MTDLVAQAACINPENRSTVAAPAPKAFGEAGVFHCYVNIEALHLFDEARFAQVAALGDVGVL